MLCGDTSGRAVRASEYNRAWHIPTGHIIRLTRGVDNLVNGLHCKVEGHELATK